jgi:hypothetical protein
LVGGDGAGTVIRKRSVLKWETKAFAQTAVHPAGNRVVYSIKVGDVTYQVARRRSKVEMTIGEKIECRVEKDKLMVRDDKGKETKYDVLGTAGEPRPQ